VGPAGHSRVNEDLADQTATPILSEILMDDRFKSFVRGIKYMRPGPQRNRMIEEFWKGIYGGFQVEAMDGLRIREFHLRIR
jgi:hypothetical protein